MRSLNLLYCGLCYVDCAIEQWHIHTIMPAPAVQCPHAGCFWSHIHHPNRTASAKSSHQCTTLKVIATCSPCARAAPNARPLQRCILHCCSLYFALAAAHERPFTPSALASERPIHTFSCPGVAAAAQAVPQYMVQGPTTPAPAAAGCSTG
jgi:hypothetical protein